MKNEKNIISILLLSIIISFILGMIYQDRYFNNLSCEGCGLTAMCIIEWEEQTKLMIDEYGCRFINKDSKDNLYCYKEQCIEGDYCKNDRSYFNKNEK